LVKVDDVKLRALIALLEVLMSQIGSGNRAKLVEFVQQNINEMNLLFGGHDLDLDLSEIENFEPPASAPGDMPAPEGLSRSDSIEQFKASMLRFMETKPKRVT
jgi:hypothetical protein